MGTSAQMGTGALSTKNDVTFWRDGYEE